MSGQVIKGRVTDKNGLGISGAIIAASNSKTSVDSDFDGNFTINTDEALPITLEVSYLGFGTKMIEVT